jgi:hypothetical protein
MLECCGGEWLVQLPGIGIAHLPLTSEGFQRSVALPVICLMYAIIFVTAYVLLLLHKCRHIMSASIALGFSSIALPLALRPPSPLIGHVVAAFEAGNPHTWDSETLQFAQRVKAQGSGLVLQNVTIMDKNATSKVAAKVVAMQDHWSLAPSGGLPHMTLGVKYSGTLSDGEIRSLFHPHDAHSELMWKEFSAYYGLLQDALAKELQAPVAMHRWLWPPPFLIWLSSAVFATQSDVHFDLDAARYYEEHLQRHWAAQGEPPRRCRWDQQHTLIAALQVS